MAVKVQVHLSFCSEAGGNLGSYPLEILLHIPMCHQTLHSHFHGCGVYSPHACERHACKGQAVVDLEATTETLHVLKLSHT